MILVGNAAPSSWDGFLAGDEALLCTLDRAFDEPSVFMMRSPSFYGSGLGTHSAKAVPHATKVRGCGPRECNHNMRQATGCRRIGQNRLTGIGDYRPAGCTKPLPTIMIFLSSA